MPRTNPKKWVKGTDGYYYSLKPSASGYYKVKFDADFKEVGKREIVPHIPDEALTPEDRERVRKAAKGKLPLSNNKEERLANEFYNMITFNDGRLSDEEVKYLLRNLNSNRKWKIEIISDTSKGVDAKLAREILVKKLRQYLEEIRGDVKRKIEFIIAERNKGIKVTTHTGIKLLLERQYDLLFEAVKNTYGKTGLEAFEYRTKKYVEPPSFSYSLLQVSFGGAGEEGKYVYVEARIKSDEKEEEYYEEMKKNPYLRDELGYFKEWNDEDILGEDLENRE